MMKDCDFKTTEDKEYALKQWEVLLQLKSLKQPMVNNVRYFLYYLERTDEILVDWRQGVNYGDFVVFADEQSALRAIDLIGKDKLKKYYFGVKE